jgi:hypothetical protein
MKQEVQAYTTKAYYLDGGIPFVRYSQRKRYGNTA